MRSSLVALSCLFAACGGANSGWADEVRRQSTLELDCPDHRVAVQRYLGHNYEAFGCDRAIRYVCQDRVCTTASEALPASTPALQPFVERVEATRAVLVDAGEAIVRACSEGRPFSATLTIEPSGNVSRATTATRRDSCVLHHTKRMAFPSGTGVLQLTHIFRGD